MLKNLKVPVLTEKRCPIERRVLTRTSNRGLRRFTVCVLGTVLSCYILLFVVVISRHLDAGAENELRRNVVAAAEAAESQAALNRAQSGMILMGQPGFSTAIHRPGVSANREALLGYLGLHRFQGRESLVAKLLDENGKALIARRKAFRVCLHPRLREPPGPVVALASFPGSGNTWVRYLVQQTTGYLTGSVYRDFALMRYGFPAESVVNGSVTLVKTHEWGPAARQPFQGAVLLVRDPFGALLAEFNRRSGGHLGHAASDKFKRGRLWKDYVSVQLRFWVETILDWLKFEGPLHVIRYEDIMGNLYTELSRLMHFLNITVHWPAYNCVLNNRDGIFKRAKSKYNFDPYEDSSMQDRIKKSKLFIDNAIALQKQGFRSQIMNLTFSDVLKS